VGLVPTESSSGAARSQGSITKTGNAHDRRLLIEAAWQQRLPYRTPSVELRRRWEKASPAARARGQQGVRRLHARWQRFDARRKRPTVANTAIARELAGWCWSLAILEE
jgi:transposase